MNREEAKQLILTRGWVNCDDGVYYENQYQCNACEDDYVCCQDDFYTLEETLADLEDRIRGNWEEVW